MVFEEVILETQQRFQVGVDSSVKEEMTNALNDNIVSMVEKAQEYGLKSIGLDFAADFLKDFESRFWFKRSPSESLTVYIIKQLNHETRKQGILYNYKIYEYISYIFHTTAIHTLFPAAILVKIGMEDQVITLRQAEFVCKIIFEKKPRWIC